MCVARLFFLPFSFLFFFSFLFLFFLSLFRGYGKEAAIGLFFFFSKLLILVGSLGSQSAGLEWIFPLYNDIVFHAACAFSKAYSIVVSVPDPDPPQHGSHLVSGSGAKTNSIVDTLVDTLIETYLWH